MVYLSPKLLIKGDDDSLCNISGSHDNVGDTSIVWVNANCLWRAGPNGLPLGKYFYSKNKKQVKNITMQK